MNNRKSGNEIRRLVEQLADIVRIDDLAERLGIPVKRSGNQVIARCIVHDDTNPSMMLYPGTARDKAHYHCYVCDAHGDIFELVKQAKGLGFSDAVHWLATTYGIAASPQERTKHIRTSNALTSKEQLEESIATNSGTYETALAVYRRKNPAALIHWLNRRGLSTDVATAAELGFANPGSLVEHVQASKANFGITRELLGQLQDAGLVRTIRNDPMKGTVDTHLDVGSRYRDFFRDSRVVFPVRDAKNYLVGFAGRAIDDSSTPKYLYTPNLPKGKLLYRGANAFSRIKNELPRGEKPVLYICEGLVDALRIEELGLAAVAVLGARLSEAQAQLIIDFAATLPDMSPLQIRVFLDKDGPGLKGAVASLDTLIRLDRDIRLELGFVWPSSANVSGTSSPKDPDDFLRQFEKRDAATAFLDQSTYPVAVAFLAERLNVPPSSVTDDSQWDAIPLGAKYRLALLLEHFSRGLVARVLSTGATDHPPIGMWHQDVERFINNPTPARENPSLPNREEIALQLNIARELARSGANKGEVLSDIAAWRRIELAATAFNEGLISRLKQAQFQPIEPFDAVFVSRGFGKEEHRLKAMPCQEDLILQQYVLNELLTERLDHASREKFSNYIPAVRYYRSLNLLRTTGESGAGEHSETLSFAYQIDMDAVEGRAPVREGGMFRPYFECWKDFISSLVKQGGSMNHVYMVRLDLKRYYDNITRLITRDLLVRCISPAYANLGDGHEAFMPLFCPGALQNERQRAVVDFLLDQSFGFSYYDPRTGNSITSDRERGIPQGPVLSAWLGNIILFKLDGVMRAKLEELNSGDMIRAGYARYVDDVVLLGESQGILDVLRASAEDVVRALQLELISKENFAPMSTAEFLKHLTSGRALPASGPREEAVLLESGDGDAGWDMWHTEGPQRQTSLELLRDSRLYALPSDIVRNQVFTALRAEDLRPAELSKASRWLWYQAAQELKDTDYTAQQIVSAYWKSWTEVCAGAPFSLDTNLAWDDPAFYALEGLESLLERANGAEYGLTPEEATNRTRCVEKLARAARSLDFSKMFARNDATNAPRGWGQGTEKLPRMYFQRIICMRWKAARLTGGTENANSVEESAGRLIHQRGVALQASLRRSFITDAETWGHSTTSVVVTAGGEGDWNTLSEGFQWLHRAIVEIANTSENSAADPLSGFLSNLELTENRLSETASHFAIKDDKFFSLLRALLPNEAQIGNVDPSRNSEGEIALLALQTLAAIAPRQQLPHLLSNRTHLLQQDEPKLPLPPLPGVPANGLLLISHSPLDSSWTQITAIWWMTLPHADGDCPLPSFRLASAAGTVREVAPEWQKVKDQNGLEIYRASWEPESAALYALVEPPPLSATPSNLKWVANAYEAIARLNHGTDGAHEANPMEYVPAWPYLVVSTRPDVHDSGALELILLSLKYSRSSLDGFAYIRHGSRGLGVYEIPELYGRHWRTGVLLSDLFGFRRDLDQYASLSPRVATDKDRAEGLNPAAQLLRNVLRKLRGAYASGRVLQSQPDGPHIPATVARSLELLRAFPDDGSASSQLAYVAASESETVGMHLRLTADIALEYPGVAAAYIEQVATKVVNRIPLDWSEYLIDSNDSDRLRTSRVIPQSYWNLASQFASLSSAAGSIDNRERSLSALIAGLRLAAVTAWIREVVLSIQALPECGQLPLPQDGGVADTWQMDERGFLFDRPDGTLNLLSDVFTEGIKHGTSGRSLTGITPFGWLTLLSARVGLFGNSSKMPTQRVLAPHISEAIKKLAKILSEIGQSRVDENEGLSRNWPFEFDNPSLLEQWMSPAFTNASEIIGDIELNFGLRHIHRVVAPWRLDPVERTFTDNAGTKWTIAPWQVVVGGGSKPDRMSDGKRLLSIWGETRDAQNNLLMVSARSERLAKLLGASDEQFVTRITDSTADNPTVDGTPDSFATEHIQSEAQKVTQETREDSKAQNGTPAQDRSSATSTDGREFESIPPVRPPVSSDAKIPGARERWRELQRYAWQLRRAKSAGHIRIALMQWKLDETYHHPAIDASEWDGRWPPGKKADGVAPAGASNEPLAAVERSEIEHRRRKFLDEALTACESFGVDLLVLPEYSVRPETIGWLKVQLQLRAGAPSVIAGTFKLHGRPEEVNFGRVYSEILGLTEYRKTFDSNALTAPANRGSYNSGEHSSILTLLAPLMMDGNEQVVCVFSRRKKYPSMAASEIFNPPFEPLKPLFSTSDLLEELDNRSRGIQGATAVSPVSAKQILHYSSKLRHLECIAEFVCSELFLPMSLANQRTLATELLKLGRRFGSNLDEATAMKYVQEDVETISEFLGMSAPSCETKRRTILIVPAMTTRSADYWIFGQAALLAGGATTVFCNAVDAHSVGGSCFIGRNSWNGDRQSIHHDKNVTPYAGWSKGIYYGGYSDALGEREQAMVIADVDPIFMQEGKPRPQALANPLQLVAYLPIVEVEGKAALNFDAEIRKALTLLESTPIRNRIVSPSSPGINPFGKLIAKALEGDIAESRSKKNRVPFEERVKHWEKYWNVNPFVGMPPPLMDWLWVDSSASDTENSNAEIFIFGYSDDPSLGPDASAK